MDKIHEIIINGNCYIYPEDLEEKTFLNNCNSILDSGNSFIYIKERDCSDGTFINLNNIITMRVKLENEV